MSLALDQAPPELRLLLSLLRSALGTAPLASPPATVPWPAFFSLVERHRVGAFLYQRAAAQLDSSCPPAVVARIRTISLRNTRHALAQAAEQIRLVQTLAAAGISVLSIKGLVLARRLYCGLGARPVGDIDFLVRPPDVERADAILQSGGFQRRSPDFFLTPLQLRRYMSLRHEFSYVRATPPLAVELAWRLEGFPDSTLAWRSPAVVELGGQSLSTLAPEIDAVYLLQHGAKHLWTRLFWLVDAALLMKDPAVSPAQIIARAREAGLERAALQSALLAETLLGVARSESLRPQRHEKTRIDALAADAWRKIRRPYSLKEPPLETARDLLHQARLRRRIAAKLEVIAPAVLLPNGWGMCPLPDRWFFLHYFAVPFLWLWRRARPSRRR